MTNGDSATLKLKTNRNSLIVWVFPLLVIGVIDAKKIKKLYGDLVQVV